MAMKQLQSWLRKKQLMWHPDQNVRLFTTYVDAFCKVNDVALIFDPNKLVDIGNGQMCNGYFCGGCCDEEEYDDVEECWDCELVVATGKPLEEWLQILVHEFAHCTQWVEDSLSWHITELDDGNDAYTLLQNWMTGDIELMPEEAECYAALSRMHEHDCDQRALKLIETWDLPINSVEYIQKSNAYHLFYNYIGKTGKWYPEGVEPYKKEMIWKNMPTEWLEDYDNPPEGLMDLYFEVYGE